jgi:phosphoribosylaminoimidazolecarboxamide formyltransferase/IMP cyclohydrolase
MVTKKKKTVLISVADKTGLVEVGERFVALKNWRILSSGGTGKALTDAGIPVMTTAEFSGICMANKLLRDVGFEKFLQNELGGGKKLDAAFLYRLGRAMAKGLQVGAMFSHRLATISSPLYGGLLADPANEVHMNELKDVGWKNIDAVFCDFYPLERTLDIPGVTLADVIKQWDVGGPAMIMAAAKSDRLPVCRIQDRHTVLRYLEVGGEVPADFRALLRERAVTEVGKYYTALGDYLVSLRAG